MEDIIFIKPKRVNVDALNYLSDILKNGLIKDLQENQILCSECKGTGLAITNNIYGLKNDPDKSKHFPYNNQYIVSCQNCYSGVVNQCEHCNSELPRGSLRCDCDKAKSISVSEEIAKENELLDKAIKIKSDNEIAKSMGMYYYDGYSWNNGYFSEFEEFIDWWEDNHDEDVPKPQYVWGTYEISLSLNAEEVLERACEDLHEDAGSNLSDIDELQKYLDEWCKKQKRTNTYYWDTKYAIEIPWEGEYH